jgi:Tfp pilus assembly protein FimT
MRSRTLDVTVDDAGYSLLDILVVASLMVVIVGTAVPQVTVGLQRATARAAARYLTAQMSLARVQAVGRAATVAIRFARGPAGVTLSVISDGNRNGVLTRDIDSGLDRPIQAPVHLDHLFPGVVIGVPADSPDDPVQLSGSDILSFTPGGTATSGTVHVLGRDGSRFAVRVLGATGRVRLLQWHAATGEWVESF